MSCRLAGRSTRRTVSSMTWLRSANFFSGGRWRAKSSRRRMIVAQRLVSRITRSRSSASWLPSGSFLRIRCEKVRMPVSGLLSSCAMPAASRPTEASFSRSAAPASAARSLRVRSSTFSSSVCAPLGQLAPRIAQRDGHGVEGGRHLAEFVRAAHRDRLLEVAGREPLRAGLQVAQRHVDQAMHQQAERERGEDDESHREADHVEGVAPHGAVDLVQRVDDVQHAEHRLVLAVRMAGRRVAGRLVAHHLHDASSRPPSGVVKIRQRSLLGICASGFSLWWQRKQPSALRSTVWPSSGTWVEWMMRPSLLRILTLAMSSRSRHVLDDPVHVGGLVLQHREARALRDHLGQPGDVGGRLVEQRGALVLHHRQRERHHRRRQGDGDEQGDLELEG